MRQASERGRHEPSLCNAVIARAAIPCQPAGSADHDQQFETLWIAFESLRRDKLPIFECKVAARHEISARFHSSHRRCERVEPFRRADSPKSSTSKAFSMCSARGVPSAIAAIVVKDSIGKIGIFLNFEKHRSQGRSCGLFLRERKSHPRQRSGIRDKHSSAVPSSMAREGCPA